MTPLHLDRLSALLEGLAPKVTLGWAPSNGEAYSPADKQLQAGLWMGLVSQGTVHVQVADRTCTAQAPCLIACRASHRPVLRELAGSTTARVVSAYADLTGPVASLFLQEFAQARLVQLAGEEPSLRLAVTMIESELSSPRCGQPALLGRAGDILFIGLLRHLVANPSGFEGGLFNGLSDPRVAKALVAIHQHPSFAWSLESLAAEAGMSRTAFAATFKRVMRRTPGRYLATIRLALAQRAVETGKGLKEVARAVGYINTSALSRALSKARVAAQQVAQASPGSRPVS